MDRIESYKVVCSGGLNSNENHLDMAEKQPGFCYSFDKLRAKPFGGYRRIEGFDYYDSTVTYGGGGYGQEVQALDGSSNPVAEGKILGVAMYRNEVLGNPYPIAMRKDVGATTYSFWKYTPLVGWSKFSTGLTHNTVSGSRSLTKVRSVQFNFGSGSMIAFVDGVNPCTIFDGTNWKQILSTNNGVQAAQAALMSTMLQRSLRCLKTTSLSAGIKPTNMVWRIRHPWMRSLGQAADSQQYSVGYNIVQIKPFREDLFVFGTNAIKKFRADTATNAPAPFKADSVTTNVGCIARDSVQELGGDLVFLAPDGLRPCAGTARIGDVELSSISKAIQGRLIDIIKNEDLSTLNSTVIRSKSQVRFLSEMIPMKVLAY